MSAMLKEKIRELHPEMTKRRLLALCETRWVERHEAVQTFVELYEAVVLTLQSLQDDAGGGQASAKAHQLVAGIVTPTFIVGINIAAKVLSLTVPLSRQLQTTSLDVIGALSHVDDVEAAVQELRQSGISTVFQAAISMAEAANVEIRMPRVTSRQRHRQNIPAIDVEDYFRLSLFLPFLDHLITQLDDRFKKHRSTLELLSSLLPENIFCDVVPPDAEQFSAVYSSLVSISELQGELLVWAVKCRRTKNETPTTPALQAVALCPQALFPNVHSLLKMLATLPVTTAEAERPFSSLRRLKTYLRSSTSNDRLLGLALLNVHRDIEARPEDVLDVLCREGRRLQLNV
ncbi:unnamed protein product [Ixodes hexagonus]